MEPFGDSFINRNLYFHHWDWSFGWLSDFFDCLATKRFNLKQYILSQYYLYLIITFLIYSISLILFIVKKYDTLLLTAITFFDIGIAIIIVFYFSLVNNGNVILMKKKTFNRSEHGGNLIMLLLYGFGLCTMLFEFLLKKIFEKNIASLIILFIGLVFIVLHNYFITKIVNAFIKMKYIKLDIYRK